MPKFKIVLVFTIFCNGIFTDVSAQRKVKSGSYNLLLKKLLTHNVPEITVDSLSKIKDNVLLLDAREPEEFDVSHLNNAKFVGYKNFSLDSTKKINKNSAIVVYCSVGYRREKITQQLIAAGFTNVQNLYGGIFEWKNRKLDVFDANGVTNNVHPYCKTWGLWLKNADKVYKTP